MADKIDQKYDNRDKVQAIFKDTDVPKKETLTLDDLLNAKAKVSEQEEYLDDDQGINR